MKILIADDEIVCCEYLRRMLMNFNCEVDIVHDGESAVKVFLENLKEVPYDLICLDIMMPFLNGHEALKQIRQLESEFLISPENQTKIVMITGLDDLKNVKEAYYEGNVISFVPKPINEKFFEQLLKNILD